MKLTEDQEPTRNRCEYHGWYDCNPCPKCEKASPSIRQRAKGEGKVATLPLKWRVRAKSCDPSAKDAFMWAADELEKANAEHD